MPHHHAQPSRALVAATILFYLFAALTMVVANKWVLNTTSTPLFYLVVQFLVAVVLFIATNTAGVIDVPAVLELQTCKDLIPMVGLNVVGLSFSNYTLKYVDASFYQVARGLILPFTVATSFFVLHARPSSLILFACSIVTVGFFIGVFLDGTTVSLIGVSFGVASSFLTSIHAVVIKRSLDVVKGNALHLSWYTNVLSAAVLAPIVLVVGEGPGIIDLFFGDRGGNNNVLWTFIWGSLITGALGFMMSIASLLSIKNTSPITHMITSAVRGVFATLLGVWLFHDVVSMGRISSIAIILAGSIYYTWLKHLETVAASHKSKNGYENVPLEDVEEGKANGVRLA